ncbi:hypothetical protein APHAL10511_007057 [Amanita phalloides]|nr:hypothetical protein APHAL10511_007057 [Amanita phalloides]
MTRTSKRPPRFQHYPPNRAKKLKKSWVESAKIKSKWRTEKRKAGLPPSAQPMQAPLSREPEESSTELVSATLPSHTLSPMREKYIGRNSDHQSVRELAKLAYSPLSLHTHKSNHRRPGPDNFGRRGQPDMKLRMNAVLAKIKQNHI